MAPMWELEVGPGASAATPARALGLTRSRSAILTRRVGAHHFAQFTISSAIRGGTIVDPLALEERAAIRLRETDLWMWRNGVKLFRGRIVGQTIQVTPDLWAATFLAIDYRGLLTKAARFEGTIPTWTNTAQATIAWQSIQHRQAQTGGDWGITDGTHTGSAQNRDQTDLTAGKPIGEAIDQMGALANGFDWEITPDLKLNTWSPRRTRDQGVQLLYGAEVSTYTGSAPEWGNAATFSGAEQDTNGVPLSPVTVADGGVGSDDRGRWSVFGSSPNMTSSASVTDGANGLLADALTANAEWALTLAPGMWDQLHDDDTGIDACDLGEIVNVVLPPDNVDGTYRVTEQEIRCGDDGPGSEVVKLLVIEEG